MRPGELRGLGQAAYSRVVSSREVWDFHPLGALFGALLGGGKREPEEPQYAERYWPNFLNSRRKLAIFSKEWPAEAHKMDIGAAGGVVVKT